jgi:hypothetical protein
VFYANAAAISAYFATADYTYVGHAPPESAPEHLSVVSLTQSAGQGDQPAPAYFLTQSARQGDQPADSTLVRSLQPVQTAAALDGFFASVNAQDEGLMLARHKNDSCLHEMDDDSVGLVF